MMNKLTELEKVVERLETFVDALCEERDEAVCEAKNLRKALDERELELLQIDEESRKEKERLREELETAKAELEESDRRMERLAERIRNLLPLLPDSPEK